MRYLLVLLLILAAATPARADYWVGTYYYTIAGAEARLDVFCQDNETRRIAILSLIATDGEGRTYWLGEDADDPEITRSHAGLVGLDGEYMTWLPHHIGDRATLALNGGPCWRAVEDVRYVARAWLPLVLK